MRIVLLFPLLMIAAPAAAQSQPRPVQDIQRALNDPATAERMTNVMQSLSNAMLDLPVGEIQAAVEGRTPTAADKRRTIRDLEPDLDVRREISQARPMIQQSMKALGEALPGIVQSLQQAQRSLERAAANMPDPTYPKR
jgi:hypothetical protein